MRALRIVGVILGATLALVAIVLVVALAVLRSDWGGERVRRIIVDKANASIKGKLALARFEADGFTFTAHGATLSTPEGEEVATVDRAKISVAVLPVFSRRIEIRGIELDRPRIHVVAGEDGRTNLERALEPRQAKAEPRNQSTPQRPTKLGIELHRFRINDGWVRYEGADDPSGAEPLVAELADLGLELRGRAQLDTQTFSGTLELGGRVREPFSGPLRVAANAAVAGRKADAAVDLAIAGSRLSAKGHRSSDGDLRVHVQDALIQPTLLCLGRAACPFASSLDLGAELEVSARGPGRASFEVDTEGGGLDGRARFDVQRQSLDELTVEGRALDLRRLLTGAPPSRFDLNVKAHGQAAGGLVGLATLDIPPGRLGGRSFGPVRAKAEARGDKDVDATVQAVLPGARLDVGARLRGETIAADGRLALTSLGTLMAALRPGATASSMAGSGDVRVSIDGTRESLGVTVDARLPQLVAGALAVRQLTLAARLPALPDPRDARVDLRLARLQSGTRDFGAVRVTAARGGRAGQVALRAEVSKPERLALTASVRMPERMQFVLDQLALDYPQARWRSSKPARIVLRDGVTRVQDLTLASGAQRLAFDLDQRRGARRLRVEVDKLDLGSLPRLVQAGSVRTAGQLDARVALAGTTLRPTLDAKVTAQGVRIGSRKLGGLSVEASDTRREPLRARLTWAPPDGARPMTLEAETPFELGELMTRPPAQVLRRALRTAAPFALRASLQKFPLALIDAITGDDRKLEGELTVNADLAGPLLAPRGTMGVIVRGFKGEGMPATDGELNLRTREGRLGLQVAARRRNATLLVASGKVTLPSSRVPTMNDLWNGPAELDAELGPLRVQHLGLVPADRKQAPRTLHGLVSGTLELRGKLGDPKIELAARTDKLAVDEQQLGTVQLHARWAETKGRLDLDAASGGNGTFKLTAEANAGSRLRALVEDPPDVETMPWLVKVDANRFDLAWLSGLVHAVPQVGGRLTANFEAKGPLGKPDARGRANLEGGSATVVGLGRYEDVQMVVEGDRRVVSLEKLFVKSGSGHAKAEGRLTLAAPNRRDLAVKVDVKDFLIRSEGQKVGTLTLKSAIKGDLSTDRLALEVGIDEVHVRASNEKRKSLQSLEEVKDLVLIKDGKPLNRHQAEKLAALLVERGASGGEARAQAPRPPRRRVFAVQVAVKASRDLWVHAEDATIEAGLSDDFRVFQDPTTRVFGTVLVRRGQITVLGRKFVLDPESTVTFAGPVDSPRLHVKATYESEQTGVTVFVSLEGSKDKPKLTLTSNPPHPQTALVTLLLTGRLDLDQQAGASSSGASQAASVLGGFLAAELQKTLAKRLPVDVLTIEPGQGPGTASLEAGTYLTDDLYVAYVGRLGADPTRQQNRNLVHLEYQLTRRWSFEAEYGDARTGSADLIWKKHY